MYLHLGEDTLVLSRDIVAVCDLDNTTVSRATRDFLTKQEKRKRVLSVSSELPKAFIITSDGLKERVYLSQISSRTLALRAKKAVGE
jgi:hypothetical protein